MKGIKQEISNYLYSYGSKDMTKKFCKLLAKELTEEIIEKYMIKDIKKKD